MGKRFRDGEEQGSQKLGGKSVTGGPKKEMVGLGGRSGYGIVPKVQKPSDIPVCPRGRTGEFRANRKSGDQEKGCRERLQMKKKERSKAQKVIFHDEKNGIRGRRGKGGMSISWPGWGRVTNWKERVGTRTKEDVVYPTTK